MNFLEEKIKPMYFKFLVASFGSTLISSIYSVVDMAVVGQYEGANGTAALAIVSSIWNIIYSLGLLMGIGGSIFFLTLRGKSKKFLKKSNEYFTVVLTGVTFLSVMIWVMIIFFDRELLMMFGAEKRLLSLARQYIFPIKFVVPCFLFTQLLSTFLRNDGNPNLATKAILFGGLLNIVGDYFFVFYLNMGITGAGLATAVGAVFSFLIMFTHFFQKKNTLKLEKPKRLFFMLREISIAGFSTFFIDIAMGILAILFNKQILRYLDINALSVYGVIINISTFVQCCAYSIGQASQPIISTNFGAGKIKRIKEVLKYALGTAFVFGVVWTFLIEFIPNVFIYIFMAPTKNILQIAPNIMRSYGISFLILPFNIFSTYYFQALMKSKTSFVISVFRGTIISGILIFLLPLVVSSNAIWFTMPLTELIVAIYVAINIKYSLLNISNRKAF